MGVERLRRVTDLFVEGQELYLGDDSNGAPVLLWVNKLNSFQVEEARRDGMVQRGLRVLELTAENNPERMSIQASMNHWSDEELQQYCLQQRAEEIYLGVVNELESDEEWREKLEIMRRLPALLSDQGARADDPRRIQLDDLNAAYLEIVRETTLRRQSEVLDDLREFTRARLEENYFEYWRNRVSLDEFMEERRVSELYFSVRECHATRAGNGPDGRVLWDHVNCNHAQRLMDDRSEVRGLPEEVLSRTIALYEDLSISARTSGNSDAPASSSASLEPSSAAEAPSTPSSPTETPLAVPTT